MIGSRARARCVGSRLIAVGMLAAGLATGVAACGGDDSSSSGGGGGGGDQVTVGLITKTDTNPFFVKMREFATQEAKTENAKLLTAAGKFDGDNATQVTAIENMVTQGAKGILITPNDTKAIVPTIKKYQQQDVVFIALDTALEPQDASDALFATDNLKAGELIGEYAKAKFAGKPAKIAMVDGTTGTTVSQQRHDGFLKGFGISEGDPQIVGAAASDGDQAKGQNVMEQLLQKDPSINLVYTINEPAAAGAYTALKAAGKTKGVTIVSVDGGCPGVENIKKGVIAATSQQYPGKMASLGVKSVVDYARTDKKPSGYTDTGVNLITDQPVKGVPSKDTKYGTDNCWG
jgi:fructose transport system substrate-binding protein